MNEIKTETSEGTLGVSTENNLTAGSAESASDVLHDDAVGQSNTIPSVLQTNISESQEKDSENAAENPEIQPKTEISEAQPETTDNPDCADKYVGKICPYCKTEIKEGEDVIACPACGIPHHRGCWEENNGCTTFGCSEQHYKAVNINPTAVCSTCGAPLEANQAFCSACGTARAVSVGRVCGKCGAELKPGQDFCSSCGQRAGLQLDTTVNSAIEQFNANVEKKKKPKIAPVIIVIALIVASAAGYFIYSSIQTKKKEEAAAAYLSQVREFAIKVSAGGIEIEDICNEIDTAWSAYVSGRYYNGSKPNSPDAAVILATVEKIYEAGYVRTSRTTIDEQYKDLLTIPDEDNTALTETVEAVKEVYEIYCDFYDCAIDPVGTYYSWKSDFSELDSDIVDSLEELFDCAGFEKTEIYSAAKEDIAQSKTGE